MKVSYMEKLTGWVKENWLSIVLFLLSSGAVVASFFAGLAEVFAAYPAQVLALIGGSLVIGAVLCFWWLELSRHAERKKLLAEMVSAPSEVLKVLKLAYDQGGQVYLKGYDSRAEYLARRGILEIPSEAFIEPMALCCMPSEAYRVLRDHEGEVFTEGLDG